MSAMPAGWTEPSDSLPVDTAARRVPGERTPAATSGPAPRRADLRVAHKLARRSQQRWAVMSCAVLTVAFGSTVGILDVIR